MRRPRNQILIIDVLTEKVALTGDFFFHWLFLVTFIGLIYSFGIGTLLLSMTLLLTPPSHSVSLRKMHGNQINELSEKGHRTNPYLTF